MFIDFNIIWGNSQAKNIQWNWPKGLNRRSEISTFKNVWIHHCLQTNDSYTILYSFIMSIQKLCNYKIKSFALLYKPLGWPDLTMANNIVTRVAAACIPACWDAVQWKVGRSGSNNERISSPEEGQRTTWQSCNRIRRFWRGLHTQTDPTFGLCW